MISYMVYEADDGKLFGTEEECLNHEYRINHLPPAIVWYDKDWDEICPEGSSEVERLYNECAIMEILAVDGWKSDLKFIYERWGFGELDMTPGFYKYIGECSPDEVEKYREEGYRIYGWDEWIRIAKKVGAPNG